ncbi:hypothetical protein [Paraglaciecola sp.]|uniref:hypothetical protein n=1 Tax=Paraglaciecola sp. TaxID=1920173 RepID=UPI003265ACA4
MSINPFLAVTTNKPSLALVSSPYQLLGAIEFQLDINQLFDLHVVFTAMPGSTNEKQIYELLETFKISHVKKLYLNNSGSLRQRIESYAKVVSTLRMDYESILLGDIRHHWMQDIACSLDAKNYVMVDDGAAVLSIYQHILSQQGFYLPVELFPESSVSRQEQAQIIKIDCGLTIRRRKLGIYSLFKIPSPFYFKRHSFNNVLKVLGHVRQHQCENEIHFIGTHFVELKLLSESDYFSYLKKVRSMFSADVNIVYFAHRGENISQKRPQLAKIGFELREISYPYEMFLMQTEKLPHRLIGFYTTCLFNVKAIFADTITINCIKLKNEQLQSFKEAIWMQECFTLYDQVISIYEQLDREEITTLF